MRLKSGSVFFILSLAVMAGLTTALYRFTQQADMNYYPARRLFQRGKYDRAITLYLAALKHSPKRADILTDLGYSFEWTGRFAEAADMFRDVLTLKPGDRKVQYALAQTLSWQRQYPGSIALLKDIVDATGDTDAGEYLAYVYLWSGDHAAAQRTAEAVLAKDPQNVSAKLILAKAFHYGGEAPKAVALYEEVMKEGPRQAAELKPSATLLAAPDAKKVEREKERAEVPGLLAEARMISKDYDKAVEEYRGILAQRPDDVKARAALADILSWQKQYGASVAEYRKALDIEPGNTGIKSRLAEVCAWNEDYAEAETLLREVIDATGSAGAKRSLAEIYLWQGKHDEARPLIDELVAARPDDGASLLLSAKLAHYTGDVRGAAAVYERLLKMGGLDKLPAAERNDARRLIAEAHMIGKEYNLAIKEYRSVLAQDPGNVAARVGLADILSWQKKYDESAREFEEALEQRPGDTAVMVKLAQVYLWKGDFPAAEKLLRESLAAAPGDRAAKRGLAELCVRQKKYPEAEALLIEFLKEQPDDREGRKLLARAYQYQEKVEDALKLYEDIFREGVSSIDERRLVSEAYMMCGRYDRAIAGYREVLKEDPKDVKTRVQLADVLSWEKRYGESVAEYDAALRDDPGNAGVRAKLAKVCTWKKDYSRAEDLYKSLIKDRPGDTGLYTSLAEIYVWTKRYGDAIALVEPVQAAHDDEELRTVYGMALLYACDYPKAKEVLGAVVARNPSARRAKTLLADAYAYSKEFKTAIELYRAILKEGGNTGTVDTPKAGPGPASWNYFRNGEDAVRCIAPGSELEEALAACRAREHQCAAQQSAVCPPPVQEDGYRDVKEKLADVLSWDKQYGESIALYDELIKEKEDPKIRLQKARVLGWSRDYVRALDEYHALYDMYHNELVKLEMEAKEYYWDGRVQRAIRTYTELIGKDPENVEAMFDLSQIYSYQSMWTEARDEYRQILAVAPGHFRAKDGLSKMELISRHISARSAYEFFEADSQSRSDDIRRNHFFNEVIYPYNDRLTITSGHKIGWRQFSDHANLIENEGRCKLLYVNNPQWSVDGFYDLILYNRGVSAMHTFGEGLTVRTFDIGQFRFSHERQRLENNSTVIVQNYFSDNFTERLDIDVTKRLKVGADYLFGNYSDCNYKHEPGADVLYYISLDPRRLAVRYRYLYRNFDDTVNEYWSPKGYNLSTWSVNWRHFLNKEEIFFGANDIYYDARYDVSLDSQGVVSHRFEAGFYWDITQRLNVNVKSWTTNASANVYTDKGVTAEVKFYF